MTMDSMTTTCGANEYSLGKLSPPSNGGPFAHIQTASESPDSPWHTRLDMSNTSASRQTLPADTFEHHSEEPVPHHGMVWSKLIQAWETSWFGCNCPVCTVEEQAPRLASYGSLCTVKSPRYMSSLSHHADLTSPQWNTSFGYRGTYWRPRTSSGAGDDTSPLTALAQQAADRSHAKQSKSEHLYNAAVPSSRTSPEGASTAKSLFRGHGSSGSKTGHAGDSSVTTTELYSQYVVLPPASSEHASDDASECRPAHTAAPALSKAPILGTWATRQYHLPLLQPPSQQHLHSSSIAKSVPMNVTGPAFMRSVQSHEDMQTAKDSADSADTSVPVAAAQVEQTAHAHKAAQAVSVAAAAAEPIQKSAADAAMEAAWRWRFTRRWHAEQQRCLEEVSATPDKHEEALAYLQAGGGMGMNMQVAIARTQSTEASGLHSIGTAGGSGSLLAGEMLLEDSSAPAMGGLSRAVSQHAALAGDSATRQVNSLNRRAMHLLEQQEECEKAAEERWINSISQTGGEVWVGRLLSTVDIDDWGTFKFLVMRVRGRNDKQRIIVRGRNYCTEAQIAEELTRKMIQMASQNGCSPEALEVMGGGVMEWRRERDRHLHLHSGFSCGSALGSGGAGKPASANELLSLSAVLTKQHLPLHFKVSIEGQ